MKENTEGQNVEIENVIGKAEAFVQQNQKKIIVVILAIVAVIGGYLALKNLYCQ